ncbi:DUF1775 domain-containing protein [Streptomyces sp. ADMS]|uniref:DUF1775 domain-containing protein n=1 Tax=Streptomyces sp. ADMS TaxID=3071415 RepID=UPI00296FB60C|nr:DUF1775 domain-containing protein [Streptomyces sp. ADMS]MDW4905349.1 DUF1775 domain-containing protein [Streptomyces sp. ADMS]
MFTALTKRGTAHRLTLVAAAAASLVLLTAGPAAAHMEVESDKAQALAENVEISFHAEAESDTAGITGVRVILPEGIAPGDVTYGEGPRGWKFATDDEGYTVKGAALKTGVSAEYSVVVRQLPDVKELAFKSLQTYGDGSIDRWIELDESGEQPAPVLKLKTAAPGAKPVSPAPSETGSASPSPSATPTAEATEAPASPAAEATSDDDGGMSAGVWTGIGAAVVVVAGAAVYLVRRRGAGQQ